MGRTKIEWADFTLNPWIGCTKVSPGCARCYAEHATPTRTARAKGRELWGKGQPRQRTSEANWKQPLRWNKTPICNDCGSSSPKSDTCAFHGLSVRRPRVFCASLADWLDDEVPIEWLADLLKLIHDTPNLDWLLLTKRPQNWSERLHLALRHSSPKSTILDEAFISGWLDGDAPSNCWIGTSLENQDQDPRVADLLKIPARVRFLSCEPLLGPVDLTQWLPNSEAEQDTTAFHNSQNPEDSIHWCITGGESGPKARPMHPDWARSLRDQCAAAGVAFHFKQWGEYVPCLVVEDGAYASGFRIDIPNSGSMSASIRERSKKAFTSGIFRKLKSGDENGYGIMLDDSTFAARVGKKAAGRLLDGREHNEFPEAR